MTLVLLNIKPTFDSNIVTKRIKNMLNKINLTMNSFINALRAFTTWVDKLTNQEPLGASAQ
jgi:hypothetical protein